MTNNPTNTIIGVYMMKPRHRRLLEELPKNGYKVGPAAVKAGYSPKTANDHPKEILRVALKAQAKEVIETINNPGMTSKEMKMSMAELIGLTREDVFKRIRYIGFEQDKDLASALKVIMPLSKDEGVNLNTEDQPKVIVPVLNIGVRNGSTEPPIDHIAPTT